MKQQKLKMFRHVPILAIQSLTRSVQSTGNRGFRHGTHRLPTSIGSSVRFKWPHITGESRKYLQTLLDIELTHYSG